MLDPAVAVSYNNSCAYSPPQTQIILSAVGGPVSPWWSAAGVTAISQWQKTHKLGDDGMMGLKTLKKVIDSLAKAGRNADANSLREYYTAALASQASKQHEIAEIIKVFQHTTIHPFKFSRENVKNRTTGIFEPCWAVRGTFEVLVKLNPQLSEDERMRYEYRQYIKGSASVQDGQWGANQVWTSTGNVVRINAQFEVPSDPNNPPLVDGLTPHFKEDGKFPEVPGGGIFRFGHRWDGNITDSPRFRNKWWPDSVSGANFALRDSPGYSDKILPGVFPKVRFDIRFYGAVVEVEEDTNASVYTTKVVRTIESKYWNCTFDGILRP